VNPDLLTILLSDADDEVIAQGIFVAVRVMWNSTRSEKESFRYHCEHMPAVLCVLKSMIKNSNVSRRNIAVNFVGLTKLVEAVDVLDCAIADSNENVRVAATQAFTAMPVSVSVPTLIRSYSDTSPRVREAAVLGLGESIDDDGRSNQNAASMSEARAVIEAALDDESARVRCAAVSIIPRLPPDQQAARLKAALADKDLTVHDIACSAAAHCQCHDVLADLMSDLDRWYRWPKASAALARLADRVTIERLLEFLQGKGSYPQQCAAARALGGCREMRAVPILLDRIPRLCSGGELLFDSAAHRIGMLKLPLHSRLEEFISALGRLKGHESYPMFRTLVSHRSARVRAMAAKALTSSGDDDEAVDILLMALYDQEQAVVEAAAEALRFCSNTRAQDSLRRRAESWNENYSMPWFLKARFLDRP
jgi:HEAT repeat protein